MNVITIGKKDFFKGQSTDNLLSDGGFSPDSIVEVLRKNSQFALLTPGRSNTEYSINITDFIAGVGIGYNGGLKYYSISENGKLYETDAFLNTHTLKHTESSKTYVKDISTIHSYKNRLHITSQTDIYRENYGFSEHDENFWTGTLSKTALTSGVPHILFEFQNLQYVTNANKVWAHDGTTGYDSGAKTLTIPDDWVINQVIVDPQEIYLFAYYKGFTNPTLDNIPVKVFVWDGYSASWIREITLATHVVVGVARTTNGKYFSANRALYKFDGYNYTVVKDNFAFGVDKLIAVEDDIFFSYSQYIFKYNTSYKALSKIASLPYQIDFLQIGYSDRINAFARDIAGNKTRFYELNNNNATAVSFNSNSYEFQQPAHIRKIEIMFSAVLITNTSYNLYIRNEVDTELANITITDTGIYKWTKKCSYHVDALRLQLLFNNAANKPFRWIKIYYEPSERSTNK